MKQNNDEQLLHEYHSNEQNLSAWIQTGIGIMIFGLVAVKFLFLKQLPLLNNNFNIYLGIGLFIAGASTLILSYLRYMQTVKLLQQGKFQNLTRLLTLITTSQFIISIALITYLIAANYSN